jgi:hypothetical protein
MTVLQLAHEVCEDYGIIHSELHHVRGRKYSAQIGAINDILICGIVPATPGHSDSVHLHGNPREELERYINGKTVHELQQLIRACYAQVELILTRGEWKSLWK